MEAPIRLGKNTYICGGSDECDKSLFRLNETEAHFVAKVGYHTVHPEMDQTKVLHFTMKDDLAMWSPDGKNSAILDGET